MRTLQAATGAVLATATLLLSPTASADAIVGSWYAFDSGPNRGEAVITFLADGSVFMAEHGDTALDPSGQNGMEHGRYTWSPADGHFSSALDADTTGQWGLSDSHVQTVNVAGDVAYFDNYRFTRVSPTSSPLVGSWYLNQRDSGHGDVVLTFLANNTFLLADNGNPANDPNGQRGMEHGSYAWNAQSGQFSFSVDTNTDGQWGMSDGGLTSITVTGGVLTANDGTTFTAIAAVPEPGGYAMLVAGLGLLWRRRRGAPQ
jgi:hypothetical protein